MRPSSLILLYTFAPQAFAARGPFSGIINYFSGNTIGNKPELTESQLIELGIGDHAYDTSKILNITDSNWKEYLGPQNTGEWLVEFTAHPDFCASCELIDLAFNVLHRGRPCLLLGCIIWISYSTSRTETRQSIMFRRNYSVDKVPHFKTTYFISYFSCNSNGTANSARGWETSSDSGIL